MSSSKAVRVEFTRPMMDELRAHLLRPDGREDAAYLVAGVVESETHYRLLVREIHKVPDDIASKGHAHVTVDPDYVAGVVKRARQTKSAVILTHSHPFSSGSVGFSGIDDGGENDLMPRLHQRAPGVPHGAIVFGQDCWKARAYLPGSLARVGAEVRIVDEGGYSADDGASGREDPRQARHEGYFPRGAAARLRSFRVGVVGAGGNGSHVVQQLALIGVRRFTVVDPDVVEETNLNRLAGAGLKDVGVPKVEVAARVARALGAEVLPIQEDVTHLSVARQLLGCDVVFGCTDNMESRIVLNRLVHQAFVPLIDTGAELVKGPEGRVTHGIVRADLVFPASPCLECRGVLGTSRPARGYGAGEDHAVSVVNLNAMAASLALDLFGRAFLGAPSRRPAGTSYQFRVLDGVLKPYAPANITGCTLCAEVLALGDSIPLPCRQDA